MICFPLNVFLQLFLDVSSSDIELSHEVEPQSFFMHDNISGRKLETSLLNLRILGKKPKKCMGGWKEVLEDLVSSVHQKQRLCHFSGPFFLCLTSLMGLQGWVFLYLIGISLAATCSH